MVYKSDHARIVILEERMTRLELDLDRIIESKGFTELIGTEVSDNVYDSSDSVAETFKTGKPQSFTESGTEYKNPKVVETMSIPGCVTNRLRNSKEIS